MMADDASRDCKVCIIEAQFCIWRDKLSDEKYIKIQQCLPTTPTCFPIKWVIMKTHFVVQRVSCLN